MMGITISVRDYYNSEQINKELAKIIRTSEQRPRSLLQSTRRRSLTPCQDTQEGRHLKWRSWQSLRVQEQWQQRYSTSTYGPENNTQLMAMVKARGNILNFVQTSMLLGQQAVRGKRPSRGYNGRVLPYFKRNEKDPDSKGICHILISSQD